MIPGLIFRNEEDDVYVNAVCCINLILSFKANSVLNNQFSMYFAYIPNYGMFWKLDFQMNKRKDAILSLQFAF